MARVKLNNVDRFNQSLERIVSNSRRPVKETMTKQARLILNELFKTTPPANGTSISGKKAERAGMKTVAGQIQKVMVGVPVKEDRKNLGAMTESHIARIHTKNRRQGTIGGARRKQRVRVPTRKLKQYIKKRQAAVGMLAAGWNAGARKFKVTPRNWPTYARRHRPNSAASMKISPTRIHIKFSNKARHAGKVQVMRERITRALYRQARNNEKVLNDYKRTAKKEGFKVS